MDQTETLSAFATLFVKKSFRSRFIHEATKRPRKLLYRICHRITDVFPVEYRNHTIPFEPEAACLLLDWSPALRETTWAEAMKQMGMGDGILVIDASGRRFYAETEAAPLSEVWGGIH